MVDQSEIGREHKNLGSRFDGTSGSKPTPPTPPLSEEPRDALQQPVPAAEKALPSLPPIAAR